MKMSRNLRLAGLALILISACASKPKVLVPPRVDLSTYPTMGIVIFTSNTAGNLDDYATQKFMQSLHTAQPGVRILELGTEVRVLESIDRDALDFEAARAIGKKWGVDAVFIGHLDVTDVKPRLDLRSMIKTLSVSADVSAALQARLIEAKSGATVWTRSSSGEAPVAHVTLGAGFPDFGATDPDKAYGQLVHTLVNQVSGDFYASWRKQ